VPNEIVIEAMIKGLHPGPTVQYFARKPPPEYVGNHPTASVASASHSQASWPQLPPPPPLQPTYSRGQPEGRQYPQQQREVTEESEAHTINSTVPESKHIY
jgi:hypothetical protein